MCGGFNYPLSSIDSRNINNKFPSFYFYFVMDIKGDSLLKQTDRVFTNTKLKESHKGSTKTLDTHKNSSYSPTKLFYNHLLQVECNKEKTTNCKEKQNYGFQDTNLLYSIIYGSC